MWPSNDRTGSRIRHVDGTCRSNGVAVKNTQDNNENGYIVGASGDES